MEDNSQPGRSVLLAAKRLKIDGLEVEGVKIVTRFHTMKGQMISQPVARGAISDFDTEHPGSIVGHRLNARETPQASEKLAIPHGELPRCSMI